ncbi:hypothetical protein BDD12DRAFT_894584 [Trichophaea hybrida]|nr:hypothetical protein BDD12DRAFT_894584 [Trichophaea hybrida]
MPSSATKDGTDGLGAVPSVLQIFRTERLTTLVSSSVKSRLPLAVSSADVGSVCAQVSPYVELTSKCYICGSGEHLTWSCENPAPILSHGSLIYFVRTEDEKTAVEGIIRQGIKALEEMGANGGLRSRCHKINVIENSHITSFQNVTRGKRQLVRDFPHITVDAHVGKNNGRVRCHIYTEQKTAPKFFVIATTGNQRRD